MANKKYDIAAFKQKYPDMRQYTDEEIFDSIKRVGKKKEAEKIAKQKQMEEANAPFTQKLSRYAKDALGGVIKGGEEVLNTPYKLNQSLFKDTFLNPLATAGNYLLPHVKERDYAKLMGQEKEDTADKLLQGIGQFAPGMLAPEANLGKAGAYISSKLTPKLSNFVNSVLGNSLSQGMYTASQSEDPLKGLGIGTSEATPLSAAGALAENVNPWVKNIGKIAAGGIAGLGTKAAVEEAGAPSLVADALGIAAGAVPALARNPKLQARKDVLERVNPNFHQDTFDAAKRLGLNFITPAEVTQHPFAGAREGKLGRSSESSEMQYNAMVRREKGQIDKINEFLHMVSPGKKAYEELYATIKNDEIPSTKVRELKKSSPVIADAFKSIKKDKVYQEALKNVPETSALYLQKVEQYLNSKAQEIFRSTGKSDEKGKIYEKLKNKVGTAIEQHSPNYKEAKQLFSNQKIREDIEDKLKLSKINPTSFNNKVLKNEKNYKILLKRLKGLPADRQDKAIQMIKDMKEVYPKMFGVPDAKAQRQLERTGMNQNKNDINKIYEIINNYLLTGKYDKEAVKTITSPNWQNEIQELLKPSKSREKILRVGEKIKKGLLKSGQAAVNYQAAQQSSD